MPYYTTQEFAREVRRPPETARYWRSTGYGPSWFKVGRKVLYDVDEVHAWIRQLKAQSAARRIVAEVQLRGAGGEDATR